MQTLADITINHCCDLTGFPFSKTPCSVYQTKSCLVPCEVSSFTTVTIANDAAYCDMINDGGGYH